MKNSKSTTSQILIGQFEVLIKLIKEIKSTTEYTDVRYKPLFSSYNSHIKTFIQEFPHEYKLLNLEHLPLQDKNGNDAFTGNKLSTLLHQSEFILALLKSISRNQSVEYPDKITLKWLYNNVPYSCWAYIGGFLLAAFFLGLFVGKSKWYGGYWGQEFNT